MTTLVKTPRTPSPASPKLTVISDGNNDQKSNTAFSPPASRTGSAPNTPTSTSSSPTSCNGGNGMAYSFSLIPKQKRQIYQK